MQKPNGDPKLEGDDGNENKNKNNKHYILIEVKLVEDLLTPIPAYPIKCFSWFFFFLGTTKIACEISV